MADLIDINELKKILVCFAKDRDWEKFHDPKNLSMAIAGETGELLEIFQWLTSKESFDVKNDQYIKEQVGSELADIIMYIARLADLLDINLNNMIYHKLTINNDKYPVDKVKGSAKKYTQYIK